MCERHTPPPPDEQTLRCLCSLLESAPDRTYEDLNHERLEVMIQILMCLRELCAHRHLETPPMLSHVRPLAVTLLGLIRSRRHPSQRAALRPHALASLSMLCSRRKLHPTLLDLQVDRELLLSASAQGDDAEAEICCLLALLKLMRPRASPCRRLAPAIPGALETLRTLSRSNAADQRVRAAAAVALCFIAADAQSTLRAGQPPREQWSRLVELDLRGIRAPQSRHPGDGPEGPSHIGSVLENEGGAEQVKGGEGPRAPHTDGDFFEWVRRALHTEGVSTREEPPMLDALSTTVSTTVSTTDELRRLALQSLQMLALKWEFHQHVFTEALATQVAAIARGDKAEADAKRLLTGGDTHAARALHAGAARASGTQRAASQLLATLMATRELRLAARHALPGAAAGAVETAHVSTLVAALATASIEVVRVALSALATLVSHVPNREKLSSRHCCAELLGLAQSEAVPVQRCALRTLRALAASHSSKEEMVEEGAIQLLLGIFASTLGPVPSTRRHAAIQHARQLGVRRLAISTLATLSDSHLRVQATMVREGALPQLLEPLRLHLDALEKLEKHNAMERAATSGGLRHDEQTSEAARRMAAKQAAKQLAEVQRAAAAAALDETSRYALLRIACSLCLDEANHAALLKTSLLELLGRLVLRGTPAERHQCALVFSHLAPNGEAHRALLDSPLMSPLVPLPP